MDTMKKNHYIITITKKISADDTTEALKLFLKELEITDDFNELTVIKQEELK